MRRGGPGGAGRAPGRGAPCLERSTRCQLVSAARRPFRRRPGELRPAGSSAVPPPSSRQPALGSSPGPLLASPDERPAVEEGYKREKATPACAGGSRVCVLPWLLSSPVHAWGAGGALEGLSALSSAAKRCDRTAAPLQECHPRGPRRAPTTPPRRGQPPAGSSPKKAESPFRRAIGWQRDAFGSAARTCQHGEAFPRCPRCLCAVRSIPPVSGWGHGRPSHRAAAARSCAPCARQGNRDLGLGQRHSGLGKRVLGLVQQIALTTVQFSIHPNFLLYRLLYLCLIAIIPVFSRPPWCALPRTSRDSDAHPSGAAAFYGAVNQLRISETAHQPICLIYIQEGSSPFEV